MHLHRGTADAHRLTVSVRVEGAHARQHGMAPAAQIAQHGARAFRTLWFAHRALRSDDHRVCGEHVRARRHRARDRDGFLSRDQLHCEVGAHARRSRRVLWRFHDIESDARPCQQLTTTRRGRCQNNAHHRLLDRSTPTRANSGSHRLTRGRRRARRRSPQCPAPRTQRSEGFASAPAVRASS